MRHTRLSFCRCWWFLEAEKRERKTMKRKKSEERGKRQWYGKINTRIIGYSTDDYQVPYRSASPSVSCFLATVGFLPLSIIQTWIWFFCRRERKTPSNRLQILIRRSISGSASWNRRGRHSLIPADLVSRRRHLTGTPRYRYTACTVLYSNQLQIFREPTKSRDQSPKRRLTHLSLLLLSATSNSSS